MPEWNGRDVAKLLAYIHDELEMDPFKNQIFVTGLDGMVPISLVQAIELLPYHGEDAFYILQDGPGVYTCNFCSYEEFQKAIVEDSITSMTAVVMGWDMPEATPLTWQVKLTRDILREEED